MPLIGYARVSTEDQTPPPQSQALQSAGCAEIHEEREENLLKQNNNFLTRMKLNSMC